LQCFAAVGRCYDSESIQPQGDTQQLQDIRIVIDNQYQLFLFERGDTPLPTIVFACNASHRYQSSPSNSCGPRTLLVHLPENGSRHFAFRTLAVLVLSIDRQSRQLLLRHCLASLAPARSLGRL
jgi:hypothetical protein